MQDDKIISFDIFLLLLFTKAQEIFFHGHILK